MSARDEKDKALQTALARYTDRAQKTVDLALREALSLGANYVGTEHILLALLRDPESLAFRALDDVAGADKVRDEVIRHLQGRPSAGEAKTVEMRAVVRAVESTGALKIARRLVAQSDLEDGEGTWHPSNSAPVIQALALLSIAETMEAQNG